MLRILIFIVVLFFSIPYIKKAKNAVIQMMPDTISTKKIGDSLNKSYKEAIDKVKK